MILMKFFTIAACWLHAGLHDKATGYASFFCIIILCFLYERHKHDAKAVAKKPNVFVMFLNTIVGISIIVFLIMLHFDKTTV